MAFLSKQFVVLTRMKAKGGMEEKLGQELVSLVAPSQSEDGCVDFNVHQSIDDKGLFMLYSTWDSREGRDKYIEKDYYRAFAKKTGILLDGPPEVTFWEKTI
ncbi:MAG: putative quinol monooxygenase [Candidatus Omnitrophota bacterium]|nr:putative quinol monooxygenase [Candidatus Omnitrophota bacterium]